MAHTKKILALAVLCLAVQGGHAACTTSDYTSYYDSIIECLGDFVSDIQGCAANGAGTNDYKGCICGEIRDYFNCLTSATGNLCVDSSTRSSLKGIISAYKSIAESICTGQYAIFYPKYTVIFTFKGNLFVNWASFTSAQYKTICENVFKALGYEDEATAGGWCTTWNKYLKLSGLVDSSRRRGQGDDLKIQVDVPEDQILPPDTDVSSVVLPYTDTSGGEQNNAIAVDDVTGTATSTGGSAASLPQTVTVLATGLLTVLGAALAL